MVSDRTPAEEQVKKRWLEQEYENLRVVESGSAWIGEPDDGGIDDTVVFEVPVQGRQSTPAKKIDVVAIHDVPFENISEIEVATQSAWSIADPSKWELADIGQFIRQIIAEMADSTVEVSIYEAKVTLRYGGLGQIQSYPNWFVEDYGGSRNLQIRETGLIYWEIDEIIEEAANNEEIVLYPVEFDPNALTQDTGSQSTVEDFGSFNLDDQSRYQQTPSGSGETRKQQARLDGVDLESRFPQPHKRDQYTRLEAYRLSKFEQPPDPGEFFEEYAEDVLDQNLVLTQEEFVNAQQSPKGSGIGR